MTTVCMIACVILGLIVGLLWGFGLAYKRHFMLIEPLLHALENVVKANEEYVDYVKSIKPRTAETKQTKTV